MAELIYRITDKKPTDSPSFKEASMQELRALIALMESGSLTLSELCERAMISESRCRSAVALWEAEGLITTHPCNENGENTAYINIIDDPSSYAKRDTNEISAIEAAELIRDENLAMLIEEEVGYPPVALYKLGAISAYGASKAAIALCYKDETKA